MRRLFLREFESKLGSCVASCRSVVQVWSLPGSACGAGVRTLSPQCLGTLVRSNCEANLSLMQRPCQD